MPIRQDKLSLRIMTKELFDPVLDNLPQPVDGINPQLELLTQREQLMEDIISIVDEYDLKKGFATKDELAEFLCDAVCRNFPAE